ncbi:Fumarate reductase (quinol) [Lentibacillus sp. JNUCC-1]|uniref:NAD(P)/FAD-dependent oxidoreductase n=1 Tax=Lentibacillus sp. JNUCC-1 TaxID=2654513 RepID=UPI0012E7B24C|nr:NAD(P)/FAD-dependent oxidoreductase [Lentibacillus sp. JNUCC-1]MUV37619.1 Fumarate reductase (quinol) [Lentibacillus sp. JNUCC-1]
MTYDVIVIGGGPAGLMASVAAAEAGASVLLVDKGKKLGRKLAISGGGRCNVTNRMPLDQLIKHLPGNGKFLYSAFSNFNNESIIQYFEGLGIPLKEEDRGRMFPVSDSAKTVVDALLNELRRHGVTMRTSTRVQDILYHNDAVQGIRLDTGEEIEAPSVILASGGKSVPNTGSTGDGYPWAEKAGHTITELYPTEVPLTSSEPFIKNKTLQGLSLSDVALTAWSPKQKAIKTHRWDMIFTHFGVSGPAALRLSQYVVKALKKYNASYVTMTIDLFPDEGEQNVFDRLLSASKREPNKALRNVWKPIVSERYLLFLLEQIGLDAKTTYHQLPKQQVRELVKLIKAFPVKIDGTLSIEKAFITGGGVSLKEVNPKTLASKKMDGLYFCGEVLDIHGYTGGYNITAAFVTGHAAGTDAAERSEWFRK